MQLHQIAIQLECTCSHSGNAKTLELYRQSQRIAILEAQNSKLRNQLKEANCMIDLVKLFAK